MQVIIVTGTPGTGKTTVAKAVAEKKGYKYIDVSRLIKEKSLSEYYDKERDCEVIDIPKLKKVLVALIKDEAADGQQGIVIDSHLSHYLPKKHVNLCIVTKCSLPVLKKRLKKRGYSEQKIRENLDSEIFDICRIEALEKGHHLIIIETDKKYKLKENLS